MRTFHIFAGGNISDLSFIQIQPGDYVICADSGLKYAKAFEIAPDCVVGDFDSWIGDIPKDAEVIRCIPEKDDTDTLVALKKAIACGAKKVKIYGALGGRFDHTIANVQLLKYAVDSGCEASLEDADNIVLLCEPGKYSFSEREGWYFALFAYSPELRIKSLSGVKYSISGVVLTSSYPIGVSNEFAASEALLDVSEGTALVVMSRK